MTRAAESEAVPDRLLERAALRPGDVVVDLGDEQTFLACGALARLGAAADVLALRATAEELAAVWAACADPRLWLLVGSPKVIPLPDASADVAVGLGSDVDAGELLRVLRRGGRVSVGGSAERAAKAAEGLEACGFEGVVGGVHEGVALVSAAKP